MEKGETGSEAKPQIQRLQLRAYQIDHFRKLLAILSTFYFCIDGSEMGSGKTYVAAAIALTLGLPVVVVCPLTAISVWEKVFREYGVSTYNLPGTGGILTYETLRSTKGHQPQHGLLMRDDSQDTGVSFYASSMWLAMVQRGVLLIGDEAQKLKNNSDMHKAFKTLIHPFYSQSRDGRSRFALCSGSIIDKEDHVTNLMKLVGFIESRNLYIKPRGEVRLEGMQELYNWARKINDRGTDEYIAKNPFQAQSQAAKSHLFGLFVAVIKPGIMSIMPSQKHSKDIKNGFYVLEPEHEAAYRKACTTLARAVHYDPNHGTAQIPQENMGKVTTALVSLQMSKSQAMVRMAKKYLNTPMKAPDGSTVYPKVICYANYYTPNGNVIGELLKGLQEYNPLELTGRVKKAKDRDAIVSAFQEPNHNYRVIVANRKVGGLAINLHDTTGYFPRVTLMMPDYDVNGTHQATGRTARDGLVGTAIIRLFYGLSGVKENSILNAIARKGKNMKEVHIEQGALFPNEYENEYEAEPPVESPDFEMEQPNAGTMEEMIGQAYREMKGGVPMF